MIIHRTPLNSMFGNFELNFHDDWPDVREVAYNYGEVFCLMVMIESFGNMSDYNKYIVALNVLEQLTKIASAPG